MGNHTEALQVDFDPNQISFEEVVNLFWRSHNPIGTSFGSQYKNAIWYSDQQQFHVIAQTMRPLVERYQRELTTDVLPMKVFYIAEDYHQKYCLQRNPAVMKYFNDIYPDFRSFIDSTAAARLNGFAAGHGSKTLFEAEKNDYGIEVQDLRKEIRI